MKDYRLIINPFAELDLKLAKEWYDLQRFKLGEEFLLEVEKVLSRIVKSPKQFPQVLKNVRKAVVSRFPFSVYFTVIETRIVVFAVFHNSRNPIIWKKRSR
ncbi:MAG: hypothetical protein ACK5M7_08970 [Draconibacterium sp.]